jgi:hypothetical protein
MGTSLGERLCQDLAVERNRCAMSNSSEFCYVVYPDGTSYTTSGRSLFEAASNALDWIEVERQSFGNARILKDDDVLDIQVGIGKSSRYRVRVGRVREWRARAR